MQSLLSSKSNDEIDLREFFIVLWAYKLLIAITCALGFLFSSYYALNAEKRFSSTALFKLDSNSADNSFSNKIAAISSLSGLSVPNTDTKLPTDQIRGRIFIQNLDAKLNFQSDPYINKYNSKQIDPIWKSLIRPLIGWQKFSNDNDGAMVSHEAIWQGITSIYSQNVKMQKTKDGSVELVVTHVDPHRAAEIANVIMDEIINTEKDKRDKEQNQQLYYLSNTLSKALGDLEVSRSRLKEFALENSALPLESFAAQSFQLDALREQLSRTSELHKALVALKSMLQNKTTNQSNYLSLRQKFPIVDQVEFRRVLGQNEIISSWTWPKASSVDAVFDTLTERKNRLQSQINALQIEAERSGLALETYDKLKREAEIAEAAYTVLIEQVKAQSMVAGYRPDKTEIYEYASASINPSLPNQSLIKMIGVTLGLIIGSVLSIVLANQRGIYYSKRSLRTESQARLTMSIRALLPLRNKNLLDLKEMLIKKPRSVLRDMAVEIHKSGEAQVVVTSSRAKLKSNDLARALASYMQSETIKVAVIDFSSNTKKNDTNEKSFSVGSFVFAERAGHVSVLRPDASLDAMELLSQKDFWQNIQSLYSKFNLVFLCADNGDAISLLRALEGQKAFHITLAKTKKTKRDTLSQMRSYLPIKGLFYD